MSVEQFFQRLTPEELEREKRRMQREAVAQNAQYDVVGGSETVPIEETRQNAEVVEVPVASDPNETRSAFYRQYPGRGEYPGDRYKYKSQIHPSGVPDDPGLPALSDFAGYEVVEPAAGPYPGDVGAREASTERMRTDRVRYSDPPIDANMYDPLLGIPGVPMTPRQESYVMGEGAGHEMGKVRESITGKQPPKRDIDRLYGEVYDAKQALMDANKRIEHFASAKMQEERAGIRGGSAKTLQMIEQAKQDAVQAGAVLAKYDADMAYERRLSERAGKVASLPYANVSEQRKLLEGAYNVKEPAAPGKPKGGVEQVSIDETALGPMQAPPNSAQISLADSAPAAFQRPAASAPAQPQARPRNPLAEVNVQTRQRDPRITHIGGPTLLKGQFIDRPDEEIGAEALRQNPELLNSLEGNPTLTKAVELVKNGTMTKEQFSAIANREMGAAIKQAKAEAKQLPSERIYAGQVNGEQVRLDETGYRDTQRRLESGGQNLGSIQIAGMPEAEVIQYDAMTPDERRREELRYTAGPAYGVAEQIREQDPNAQVQMVVDETGRVRQVQTSYAPSRQMDVSAFGDLGGMDREITMGPDGTTIKYKTPTERTSRVPSAVNDIVGNAEKRMAETEKDLAANVASGFMDEATAQEQRAVMQKTRALMAQLRAAAADPAAARKADTTRLAVALAAVQFPGLDPDRIVQALRDPGVKQQGDEVMLPADVLAKYGLPDNLNEILGQTESLAATMQSGR